MINYCMKCRSQHRCGRIACGPCSRRYATHIARRIQGAGTGSFCAIEIAAEVFSPAEFQTWRVRIRNALDYRRRADRWWRDFGMIVWCSAVGDIRGIVRLGPLTGFEVTSAFDSRWATNLRAIEPTELRSEILAAIDPAVIAATASPGGRYQAVKLSIWPQPSRARTPPLPAAHPSTALIEPMPILI
jgi:hypothetical protein